MCEICSKQVEVGFRVKVEGSVVNACRECSRFGEVVENVERKETFRPAAKQKKPEEFTVGLEQVLVEDYPDAIRRRREQMGLKQEELAKLINEPTSMIHRIESGRMVPSPSITLKLERKLKMKLLDKSENGKNDYSPSKKGEITLGDLVVIRKKGRKVG